MVTPAAVPQAIVSITRRIKIFGIVRSATVVAAVGVPAQQRLCARLWHGRRARDVSAITIRLINREHPRSEGMVQGRRGLREPGESRAAPTDLSRRFMLGELGTAVGLSGFSLVVGPIFY